MIAHNSSSYKPEIARSFLGAFRFSRRAIELVWSTSHALTISLAALTLIAGLLPAGIAWVGSSFTGVFDNADVFFKLGQLAIGGTAQ